MLKRKERVLIAEQVHAVAHREAERVILAGGEAVVVESVAAARAAPGTFDRGVFAIDLPDGSGIVLAADMMLGARLGHVVFSYPPDEVAADDSVATEPSIS